MYFRNYGLAKTRLDKYLKSDVSHYPLTSNMVKATKHLSSYHGGIFIILIDHGQGIEFEKLNLSDMKNVITLC